VHECTHDVHCFVCRVQPLKSEGFRAANPHPDKHTENLTASCARARGLCRMPPFKVRPIARAKEPPTHQHVEIVRIRDTRVDKRHQQQALCCKHLFRIIGLSLSGEFMRLSPLVQQVQSFCFSERLHYFMTCVRVRVCMYASARAYVCMHAHVRAHTHTRKYTTFRPLLERAKRPTHHSPTSASAWIL